MQGVLAAMGCCSDDPPDTGARGASSVTGLGDSSGVSVLTCELVLRALAPSLAVTLFILTPPVRRGLFSPHSAAEDTEAQGRDPRPGRADGAPG